VWAGKIHRLSARDRQAIADKGVSGALAALLNEWPVAFSWDRRGRPMEPSTNSDIGAVLASVMPRPARPSLGEALLSGASDEQIDAAIRRRMIEVPRGTGEALRDAFKRGGWPEVQYALLWRPWVGQRSAPGNARSEMLWRMAITESLVFVQAGFDFAQCEHGHHLYVRRDPRQRDCPRHKAAGAQDRWRRWFKRHRTRAQ
jgi:hypothetical protein